MQKNVPNELRQIKKMIRYKYMELFWNEHKNNNE